MEEGRW